MRDDRDEIPALNAAVRALNDDRTSKKAQQQLQLALNSLGAPDAESAMLTDRLVVYGTLAPGRPNHHVISDIDGRWFTGWVEGDRYDHGWGACAGYPAMIWRPGAERIDVHVLESSELPIHWPRLDEFEGDGYRRVFVPVFRADASPIVGQIYEARFLPPVSP